MTQQHITLYRPLVRVLVLYLLVLIQVVECTAQTNSFSFTTLNCYWYFQSGNNTEAAARLSYADWDKKAGHLVGLLSADAPLFVGFQEIGDAEDLTRLAHAATQCYKRNYQVLFAQGRDSATDQDVGAILDTSRGWGIYGRPSRHADLERDLSKHMVVRLTNAVTHIDVCVVHLRVPRGADGHAKQKEQNRALLRWSMRHLANNPKANLIILGDFNEGREVNSPSQNLAVLFQAKPPLFDIFTNLKGTPVTHADGNAYDRILISDALLRGHSRLRISSLSIQKHTRTKGDDRRLYTDHFPVTATFSLSAPFAQ